MTEGPQEPDGSDEPGPAARAGDGGLAAGRDALLNAVGDRPTVNYYDQRPPAPAPGVTWPVLVGGIPPPASAFQPRRGLRDAMATARAGGDAAVLTQAPPGPTAGVLAGGGGVGKSQLAAAFAREAIAEGTDVVVWAPAGDVQQVITAYAQAASKVQAPGTVGDDLEKDARAFLDWLAVTERRWLVVLDDIADPPGVDGWWPPAPPAREGRTRRGWVIATTRLREAVLSGSGRRLISVDVYTPDESVTYLTGRLADAGEGHLLDGAQAEVAEALGHLPLALGHAAAFMINEGVECAGYLARFADARVRLEEVLPRSADTERYGREVGASLLLNLEAAQASAPVGLAVPVMLLASVLDPAGHPPALWTTKAALLFLNALRVGAGPEPVSADEARAGVRLLHRYGLLTRDGSELVGVRVHALTARAMRETAPPATLDAVVRFAAHSLQELWPRQSHLRQDLSAALRANTEVLIALDTRRALWGADGGHVVLFTLGTSLVELGLYTAAVAHWERTATVAAQHLDPGHFVTLAARNNLASAYWRAGRTDESLAIAKEVVVRLHRVLGVDDPRTLSARINLAISYSQAGRGAEALPIAESVVADCDRVLGPDDPDTLTARSNLVLIYGGQGRTGEAIAVGERVAADRERVLGLRHPDTLTARNNLAVAYWQAGRTDEAIAVTERIAADRERVLGSEHPHTLTARSSLVAYYGRAGRIDEAVGVGEQAAADCERVLGLRHPDTLTARSNLATAYWKAGRTREAIAILEHVVALSAQALGPDHPGTVVDRLLLSVWRDQP